MSAIAWPLIEIDAHGVARIEGTTTKVTEVALDEIVHGFHVEEIQRQHPHLTRGQIHAALAYYYEHQAECDRQIEEEVRLGEELCAELTNPTLQNKLRSVKSKAAGGE